MNTAEKIEMQRRKMLVMSQEQMANKMGITTQSYRNKITGKSSFKMKEVEVAAEALQVSVEQLREDTQPLTNQFFPSSKREGSAVLHGLAEQERALYERLLQDKDEENRFLRGLLQARVPA